MSSYVYDVSSKKAFEDFRQEVALFINDVNYFKNNVPPETKRILNKVWTEEGFANENRKLFSDNGYVSFGDYGSDFMFYMSGNYTVSVKIDGNEKNVNFDNLRHVEDMFQINKTAEHFLKFRKDFDDLKRKFTATREKAGKIYSLKTETIEKLKSICSQLNQIEKEITNIKTKENKKDKVREYLINDNVHYNISNKQENDYDNPTIRYKKTNFKIELNGIVINIEQTRSADNEQLTVGKQDDIKFNFGNGKLEISINDFFDKMKITTTEAFVEKIKEFEKNLGKIILRCENEMLDDIVVESLGIKK